MQFVPMCLLMRVLCSVCKGQQAQARHATENSTLPYTKPWIKMGTVKGTTSPKATLAGLLAWTNHQINLAILYSRPLSQVKSECSFTNEERLAFCYIITGWGRACCLMWTFGQRPLLIFHTKSWEQSMSSFAKCLFSMLWEIFLFPPLFIIIQWVWLIIVSNELTVSCNCSQIFHYVSRLNQKTVIGSLLWVVFIGIFWAKFGVISQN